ncbi:hypothetical protein BKA69DRAFT_1019828, partial [Paraphysoderma sedebokerense]
GDLVLLFDASLEKQWSRKLDNRWIGPYLIRKKFENGTYQIGELDGAVGKDTVAGDRLKLYRQRPE